MTPLRETYYSYLTGKDGQLELYMLDFTSRTMRRAKGLEWLQAKYVSPVEPWFVIFPLFIIALLFFHENPIWAWGLKEISK